ncbi:hypothetical protein K7432_007715 [Basidiobolus ranarum]|uniref:Uncharacterized protein n=1 Tax=Basidiobolus ranarum TaxID=34480 RepID=A0ABR2WSX1_9FUNG
MRYSLQERENILEQVTNQMFSPITMSSYYTTPRYPASEHSGKKMMLKKKLAKLLGQRSMEKQTIQQFIDESVLTCTSSLISTKEKDHIPADNDKNTLKKKKIEKLEKLEGFFGKKLSNSQLAHQNLVNSVEEPKFSDIIEPPGSLTLCPLVTYNDLSPEERRLLTKRTRKLKLLFGEPMDEQLVSKSLTNPIIAQKLLTDDSEKSLFYNFESHVTESEDFEIHPNEKRLMSRRNSKEIKRKKLGKLYQLLGVYPSSNEIEKGTPPVGDVKETLIHRNAKTAPPEIRKLQLKRANKLEKVFGQHPPKEFITVNKETELPFQKRSSVVSNLLDAEDSVEDMVHYLEILSAMNDESTDNSGVLSSDNLDDESNEEISEDNTSQDSILETNKSTRQKKLSKLRRFFGNDLGLESLIAQNILLRRELVAESIYDIGEDSEIYGQHLNAFRFGRDEASEMYIRNAMKNDLEQLRREVQELHRLNSHNSSQNSFMKRLTRTTTISRPNTLLSRHSIASTDSKNSDLKYKEG